MLSTVERAAHLIGSYLDRAAGELGVTQGEAHVLAALARGGPAPIGVLHREFGHKRSTLTNIVDRLERRKFVRREINPDDRRSFLLSLTATGEVAARRVVNVLDVLESAVLATVSERDLRGLEKLTHALADVVDNLERRT